MCRIDCPRAPESGRRRSYRKLAHRSPAPAAYDRYHCFEHTRRCASPVPVYGGGICRKQNIILFSTIQDEAAPFLRYHFGIFQSHKQEEFSGENRVHPIKNRSFLASIYRCTQNIFGIMLVFVHNIAECGAPAPKEGFCSIETYFAHKAAFTNFTFSYYDKQNRVGLPGKLHGAKKRKEWS